MSEALASPGGFAKGTSSRAHGRRSRGTSPIRASSPFCQRSTSPMRACSRKDAAVLTPMANSPQMASPRAFSTSRTEGNTPTLRRPQSLIPRQPLGGKVLSRAMCKSLKFPGSTEEDKDTDRPVAILEATAEHDDTLEQQEGVSVTSSEPKSSLDRIELQAKESLAKLKHLLYKLKTRDGEVKSTTVTTPGSSGEATVVEEEQQVFVSQEIEFDLSELESTSTSSEVAPYSNAASPITSPAPTSIDLGSLDGLEIQIDGVTATRATVTFDDKTKTAVVTVTATVRVAELEDKGTCSEAAIAMAARALARTCIDLDERVQTTAPLANAASGQVKITSSLSTAATGEAHQRAERALLSSVVVSWRMANQEFGCSPFRPVYVVKLQLLDGSIIEALFKPCMPGDRLLRWKRAPDDWVAYQMASLLGLSCVPPAVIRSGLKLGNRQFDLGVLILKPAVVTWLEHTNPVLAAGNPQTIVSDIRILDTLLGSATRQRKSFLATEGNFVGARVGSGEQFTPLTLGHPMGPSLGCAIHSMWSTIGSKHDSTPAVKVVSRSTLDKLRGLNRGLLMDLFIGVLSVEEIETILGRRDLLLAYFEGIARRDGWRDVCIQ